jgi:Na+/proline symporter
LDLDSCETLGFRHLQLAAQGIKLRSGSHTLRYNIYKYFYPIYRQAGKKMIIISYFSIALIVFLVWFRSFWHDTATSKKDLISWIALIIGPLVWPVVLPLSLLQITSKKPVVQTAQGEQEF